MSKATESLKYASDEDLREIVEEGFKLLEQRNAFAAESIRIDSLGKVPSYRDAIEVASNQATLLRKAYSINADLLAAAEAAEHAFTNLPFDHAQRRASLVNLRAAIDAAKGVK